MSTTKRQSGNVGDNARLAHLFAVGCIIRVLDFVKVILIQLANERSEVLMLEHAREDRFCEFVHVFDNEAVAVGSPGYDALE